ncbi:MAG: phage tail protein [Candidatus Gastranaerophilales bacterium]|nr:phage tail protein [Candidatus Gastranaerophilales bacterium]
MEIADLKTSNINQNGYHKNVYTKERIGTLFTYPIDYTPDDCLSCDGYSLLIEDYEDLYNVIGTNFNEDDDEEGTFRVPDYNVSRRFLQPGVTAGELIEAGLPNIAGKFDGNGDDDSTRKTGAFYQDGKVSGSNGNSDASGYYIYFDASLSSSIYGNSSTVQPPSQIVHICIKYK